MNIENSPPETIAQAIATEIGRQVHYRPVETTGAQHAAHKIAEML
jgi:hypothetical protein